MDDLKKNNIDNMVINLVNTHFMDVLRINNLVTPFFMDDLKINNLDNMVINLVNTHFMDVLRINNLVHSFFKDDFKANNLVTPFFINKFWVNHVVYVHFGQEKRVNNIGNQVVNPVYLSIHQ